MDTLKRIEQAVQLGVKAHLAFRRHTEERVKTIRSNAHTDPAVRSAVFFLEAEYNRLQHQFRSTLMALRQSDPENYNSLLLKITQDVDAWMKRYDTLEVNERLEQRRRTGRRRPGRRDPTATPLGRPEPTAARRMA
ncbi:MAG: hypothetical protein HQL82_15390 [Magnetococcales bacterium]|nr:hypothetical protein [Magnetococcales bacterium]